MIGRQSGHHHSHSQSGQVNQRATLANAYNELGKELASEKIKVVGNYTLGKVIGEGAYGKVRLGTHRLTSTRVAVKQIPKALSASLTREIHHHRRLHHPNITQLYEVIATENTIWLITELCTGGELYDYLAEKGRLSEEETRKIFGELCLAVNYIHENHVVHRDLKLENVLLDERCHVKLGDFGFTREFEQGRLLETFCGTTGYAAPEMLACKKYLGQEVDIWSLGIILYSLLVGTLPFDDDDDDVMKQKIMLGDFENPEWLSSDAQDLISSLLQQDPSKRLPVPQILAHQWFTRPQSSTEEVPSMDLSEPEQQDNVVDLADDELPNELPPASTQPIPISIHPLQITTSLPDTQNDGPNSSLTSDATFHSARSTSESHSDNNDPTTPEDENDAGFDYARTAHSTESETGETESNNGTLSVVRRVESQSTIRKPDSDDLSKRPLLETVPPHSPFEAVPEEDTGEVDGDSAPQANQYQSHVGTGSMAQPRSTSHGSSSSAAPPPPGRTPVRTKRRSVSSTISNSPPTSPTVLSSSPLAASIFPGRLDYLSVMSQAPPLAFSTPLERNLLNSLSLLGFDTAQLVHSVLTDACDASGAVWWMLKKKAERKELEALRKELERSRTAAILDDKHRGRPGAADAISQPKPAPEAMATSASSSVSSPPSTIKLSEPISKLSTIPSTDVAPLTTLHPLNCQPPGQVSSSSLASSATSHTSIPDLTFVPPTPALGSTFPLPDQPKTPPPPHSPTSISNHFGHSRETSPSGDPSDPSLQTSPDRKDLKRLAKPRSTSISMLQRATTALSVAGLSRKKSEEKVREKEREEKEAARNGSISRGSAQGDDQRSASSAHVPNKLTKSPPMTRDRDREQTGSKSPPISASDAHDLMLFPSQITPGSPWAFPKGSPKKNSFAETPQPQHVHPPLQLPTHSGTTVKSGSTLAASPSNTINQSPLSSTGKAGGIFSGISSSGATRDGSGFSAPKGRSNRASLISAFRTWFYEDKKKRKHPPSTLPSITAGVASSSYPHTYPYGPNSSTPNAKGGGYGSGSMRSTGKRNIGSVVGNQKRSSVSSRRSSSVNSRRSSVSARIAVGSPKDPHGGGGASSNPHFHEMHMISRQRSDPSRRSLGSRTPTSERGEFGSRPSSVQSFQITPITPAPGSRSRHAKRSRHSKSPSSSSAGSVTGSRVGSKRTASPLQQYHRRAGSGSSTRVVRHHKTVHSQAKLPHIRSNSTASSIHSRGSSRPGSLHELSDEERTSLSRGGSPAFMNSRKASEERRGAYTTTIMVAHRKQSLFTKPSSGNTLYANAGKSSWKKSWGAEPPGWSTRSLHAHQEQLSDAGRANIRDVFSGRTSINLGEESDWVDEDEDIPAFVGGLGQGPATTASTSSTANRHSLGSNNQTFPSSPSFKTTDLPPLFAPRNRPHPPKRNTRSQKHEKGKHGLTSSPSSLGEVSEQQEENLAEEITGSSSRARRQLPAARTGPAFKNAIQEEDEDEE